MRNAVTHGYFDVDLNRIWTTVERDLPTFAAQIRAMLQELGEAGEQQPSD